MLWHRNFNRTSSAALETECGPLVAFAAINDISQQRCTYYYMYYNCCLTCVNSILVRTGPYCLSTPLELCKAHHVGLPAFPSACSGSLKSALLSGSSSLPLLVRFQCSMNNFKIQLKRFGSESDALFNFWFSKLNDVYVYILTFHLFIFFWLCWVCTSVLAYTSLDRHEPATVLCRGWLTGQ